MPCKAYNSNVCRQHCQTQEEANEKGNGQCCIYCFNGKHPHGCEDCDLERNKEIE